MIQNGADYEQTSRFVKFDSSWGMTVLMKAATNGHVKVVKVLIEMGANVEAANT